MKTEETVDLWYEITIRIDIWDPKMKMMVNMEMSFVTFDHGSSRAATARQGNARSKGTYLRDI